MPHIFTPVSAKVHIAWQTVTDSERTTNESVNCAECGLAATVLSGDVPLCGACFYKNSLGQPTKPAEPASHDVWHRLTEAVATLETLVARIASEVEELVRKRDKP